ncbi:type IV toxin-antitoxin system AbiEi family antitoxin domain-containing protein [Agromyces mangrovi Wang et al. 2018]|uniref:type IV toxin-antitoxin system AbiEi family antitoxin domain-containing protein n=1 Tax=Agromyces mangrovi TaxID=1858653 RepID=UPI002572C057|nr:type IV toxin-antitoxin system AbiEi family antitoxin domain-containing protein [Agromyces mangrovi]BDZ66073.1 hypothetical protein GCM10025877_30110 [Agromyces mangrovi]
MTEPHLVQRTCRDLGGVARAAELAAAGVGRRALARALADGALIRLRQGIYAMPDLDPDAAAAVRHGGALGCLSAARALGLWVLTDDDRLHVSMPPTGRSREHPDCACVLHWTGGVLRPIASIVDVLRQVLACAGPEEFFVCLESAMRLKRIDAAGVARLRARVPSWVRPLVDDAQWDADSGLESLLRFRLRPYRLRIRSQVVIPTVGRVDHVIGDRLILEADGRENHDGGSERHRDLVRDAAAAALGFDTLRFDYAQIVHDWPSVRAAILAKVDAGLHLRCADRRRFSA